MPKMKTNKTAAKRFRVSGKGRVRRPKAGGNHGLINKSRKRLRRLRNNDMVPKTLQRKIKRLASVQLTRGKPCPAQNVDSRRAVAAIVF